jgi:hypothetical protein
MATEQEELRVTVTLADNASAGLEKLQAQIKELGGGGAGGNKHVEKLNEGTKALTETVMKMTGSFGEAFKSLGMLRLGFIGGVAGLAAFGYEMAKQIKDLGEYTDKIRHLGQLGKDIGIDPAAIKNISEQLRVFGVSTEQSEASLAKFAQRMAELQRDPRVRLGILQQTDPRVAADMNARIDALNKAGSIEDKLNIARQMYENIRKNARERGETEERAADEARQGMLKFGYDVELTRAGVLKKLSEEEQAAWAAKQAAAEHYSDTLGRIKGNLESIVEIQKEALTGKDSWATLFAEKFEQFTKYILELEKAGGLQGIYKRALEGDKGAEPHPSFEGRWPGENEQLKYGDPRLQKQSYRGIGVDGNPLLHQAAFVSEEHRKGVDANTEQLKRLNDLLMQAMGLSGGAAGGGGGGGLQNAAFTTGGGFGGGGLGGTTPRGFGGGGYANLGTGGGAAPYGSHVGAGGGAGAGETPAGPPTGGGGGGGDSNLTGNAFLASQRARLKKEMDDNPELKRRFAAIIQTENPTAGAQVAESAMNRAAMTGRSMESILGGGAKSFYGPVRRGQIEPTMRGMSAKTLAERYRQIDLGLAGGNLVRGATDQGSRGDPNFEAGGQAVPDVNRERFGYWGGFKGVPYSRRWAQEQQAQVARSGQTSPPIAQTPAEHGFRFGDQGSDPFARRSSLPDYMQNSQLDRLQLDQSQAASTKVEGTGKLSVHVNAPKGTNVGAEGGGLFKDVEINRQTQMEPARRGPVSPSEVLSI